MLSGMHKDLSCLVKSFEVKSNGDAFITSVNGLKNILLHSGENPVVVLKAISKIYPSSREEVIASGKVRDVNKRLSQIENSVVSFYGRDEEVREILGKYKIDSAKNKSRAIRRAIKNIESLAITNGYGNDLSKLQKLYSSIKDRKALYALRVLGDRADTSGNLLDLMKDSDFSNYDDFISSNQSSSIYSLGPTAANNIGFLKEDKPKSKQKLSYFLKEKRLLESDYRRLRKIISESRLDVPLREARIDQYGFSDLDLTNREREHVANLYFENLRLKPNMTKKAFVRSYGLDNVSSLNWILKEYDFRDFEKYKPVQEESSPEHAPETAPSIYIGS